MTRISLSFFLYMLASPLKAVGIPTFFTPGLVLFECTTTSEVIKSSRRAFKLKKYTAIRGDVIDLDKAVIWIGKKKFEIGTNDFLSSSGGIDVEIVEIKLEDRHILLKLTGKPLSRNGIVRISNPDRAQFIESRVTCH